MATKPHPARDGAAPPLPEPVPAPPPPPAVVPHRPERGMLVVATDTPLCDCPTSLDLTTEEGRCQLLNAGNGQVEIAVAHYVAHPASRVDEVTSEVSEYSRLVLIDADGHRYSTSSPVVAHRLAQALRLFGPGPFRPPLPCVVRQVRSRKSGRTYHELEVLPRAGL
jgi:hypothetical protein